MRLSLDSHLVLPFLRFFQTLLDILGLLVHLVQLRAVLRLMRVGEILRPNSIERGFDPPSSPDDPCPSPRPEDEESPVHLSSVEFVSKFHHVLDGFA